MAALNSDVGEGQQVEAKPKSRPSKSKGEATLKQKSPAEFFAENKNIAGFDNPGKSLFTTVRELVENALDSAEALGILPEVQVTIEEVSRSQFNTLVGLTDRERVDAELYDDFESEKAKEKRLAREVREQEKQVKALAAGKKVKEAVPLKSGKGRAEAMFFQVTVKDNGRGMAHDDIPNMFGKVLSGTKYGVKQTRGKFGLGAKMALIWSKMSTGLPIDILSATRNQKFVSFCRLDIDIHKNLPHVHVHEKRSNTDGWHGAKIQVTIEGNWSTYRSKIISYMRQLAVITPYAQLLFSYVGSTPDKNVTVRFARRTISMPPSPEETKLHPSAVDLLLIKRLIVDTTKQHLLQFLQHEFSNITKPHAERLISEMGDGFDSKTNVKALSAQQIARIHQLFRQAKFADPDGECLSPAGEYNLRLGIMKELHPRMVATYQGSTQVFEGHPFLVEAGVSLGGRDVKQGINVFRFANRIPLLFEQGGDVVARTATKRINWNSYKINQMQDRIGVFVSIVSTKIPFKGTGKEYIGDDIQEIASAVKFAIQQCCIQLKSKIVRQQAARDRQQRKRNLAKYIPDVSRAIYNLLEIMAREQQPKRPRFDIDSEGLIRSVGRDELTEAMLREKLVEHVDKVDSEMALEYAVQSGMVDAVREDLHLRELKRSHGVGIELHCPQCVIKGFPLTNT